MSKIDEMLAHCLIESAKSFLGYAAYYRAVGERQKAEESHLKAVEFRRRAAALLLGANSAKH